MNLKELQNLNLKEIQNFNLKEIKNFNLKEVQNVNFNQKSKFVISKLFKLSFPCQTKALLTSIDFNSKASGELFLTVSNMVTSDNSVVTSNTILPALRLSKLDIENCQEMNVKM